MGRLEILCKGSMMWILFLSYLAIINAYCHVASSIIVGCEAFVSRHEVGAMARNKRRLIANAQSSSSRLPTAVILLASIPSSTMEFSGGFDSDRMEALTERGILEANLMQGDVGVLEEVGAKKSKKKKKAKGFSTENDDSKKKKGPSTAMAVRTLSQEGVVRLNGIISASTAATLREEILHRRADAFEAISSGGEDDWRNYFADVLLKRNRCDLLLPLKGNRGLQAALHEILMASPKLSSILQTAIGPDGTLYELSALISEPGSPRQPVHPDNPHQEHSPLYTVFIALQDITNPMGPTIFLPKTNTAAAHAAYNDAPQRDAFLASRPSVAALLNAGDASLFDSRTMHCGGANDELGGETRVLLYMSFRNPRATEPIGNVGSILPDLKKMTLRELRNKLAVSTQQSGNTNDAFDNDEREVVTNNNETRLSAAKGDALAQLELGISYYLGGNGVETNQTEAVRWFELAATQGLAHAQFNLGCCHSLGIGVKKDLERAMQLFRLAADQDHPGAKEALDEATSELDKLRQA